MTGFNKVMRFCNTLQDYESAKNQGTITDDLFVVILQDKLAKFKGQTFDWSQNADLTTLATKGELEDLAEEIASNERVWAEALNDLNERINDIGTGGGGGGGTSDIVVDAALSTTSTNAIQNKAVANALNEKADASALASKQDTLVSGTNIKTVQGQSILGSGNISISVPTVDAALSSTSTNAVQNKVVKAAIDETNSIVNVLSVKQNSSSLDLEGVTSLSYKEASSGWHYYPFVALKNKAYKFVVELSSPATKTFYWHLQSDGTKIFTERAIAEGNTRGEYTTTLANSYDNLELAIYSGGAHPAMTFTIETTQSQLKPLEELDSIKERIKSSEINDVTYLASSRFFYKEDNISEKTIYPQVLKGQYKGIVSGVKISIEQPGTIVLTHAKGTNGNSPTFSDIGTYTVKKGVNFLWFASPVELKENEGIGVSPSSTASYHRANYGNQDIGSRYFTGTSWNELVNGVVMATFYSDVSNISERLYNAETSISSIQNTSERTAYGDHYVTLLGSARFGKVTTDEKPTAPVFIDGQEELVGKTIVGMKISVSKAGTMVLCKCSGYRQSSPAFTNLQTFNVVIGENYLLLDTPIVLGSNEAIGVSPSSTASYHRGGYDSSFNKGYYYYNNAWARSGADLVMAVLSEELHTKEISEAISSTSNDLSKTKSATLFSTVYPTTPPLLYSHLFIDKIYLGSQPTVPAQSVFDVYVAAMLGYKMIELNVMITSDGVPVTGHGISGKLQTLTDLSNNPVEVDVANTTFANLRNNYRYKSIYSQFRTPISSLEECLRECQRYELTPFVSCLNKSVIDLVEKVVGKRYIAFGTQRSLTNATICEFLSNYTVDQLVARCKSVGYPYILGVAPETLDALSDNEIKELIARVHAEGCWINWAGSYHSAQSNMRMKKLGLDSCASGWEVPEFKDYDTRKTGDTIKGFSEFGGSFSTSDGFATLANGQTMSTAVAQVGIIAKSQLEIHFKGKLNIKFGKVNDVFESDGSAFVVMTSIIENEDADITITSEGASSIYSINYKVSFVL